MRTTLTHKEKLNENAARIEPSLYDESSANPLLRNLALEIDSKLSKFAGHHAFVRLSSRSPKDAILGELIDRHLDDETRKFLRGGGNPIIPNMHPLVYIASAKALEVDLIMEYCLFYFYTLLIIYRKLVLCVTIILISWYLYR